MHAFWRMKVHCLSPKTTVCPDNFNMPHLMPMEAAAPTPIVSALRTLRAHANVSPSLWRFRSENGSPQWIQVLHYWPDSNSCHFSMKVWKSACAIRSNIETKAAFAAVSHGNVHSQQHNYCCNEMATRHGTRASATRRWNDFPSAYTMSRL